MSRSEGIAPPELFDIISCSGNHEVKTEVFSVLDSAEPLTVTPLHRSVMELQGDQPVWALAKNTPHDFAKGFATIGLAEVSEQGPRGALALRLSEKGRQVLPVIGHLADLSLMEAPALADFFGPMQTNADFSVRPSQRRVRIMEALRRSDGKPLRVGQLCETVGKVSVIGGVIDDLTLHDIISGESSGRGKPSVTYLVQPNLGEINFRQRVTKPLLLGVVALLLDHFEHSPDQPISNEDITEKLVADGHQGYGPDLLRIVSGRTEYLARYHGALQAQRQLPKDDDAFARSVIWANDAQLKTIDAALRVVDGAAAGTAEYMSSGREKLDAIMGDPELVNYLTLKAKGASYALKRLPDYQARVRSEIGGIVASASGPLTKREIWGALSEAGATLDIETVSTHLNLLVEMGQLTVSESDEGRKYTNPKLEA